VHTSASVLGLAQPEDVAWLGDGRLVVADTWNHRVVELDPVAGTAVVRPAPAGGWYGPRSLAIGPDGSLVVADTGNKRLVVYEAGGAALVTFGSAGTGPGRLDEPGGVAWLDERRVLVCDTGNHRLQVLDRSGASLEQIPLPEAWPDYYARPQVAILAVGVWLVTDTPGRCLWLVEDGAVTKVAVGRSGMRPTGLAWSAPKLYIGDLNGWVWELDVSQQWRQEHGG
jgi:sugar lactone lactonase YvrE